MPFTVRGTHNIKARCYDLIIFLVVDINRLGSVVNAVLRKDDVVYGTHMTIVYSSSVILM
jgi:hypothetical protein